MNTDLNFFKKKGYIVGKKTIKPRLTKVPTIVPLPKKTFCINF